MAGSGGVWGIDIGQCGLKALRCTPSDDGNSLVAEAFDFIEYPKILSQPDANPDELVRDALKQFLSRNSVRGAKVAISVSGQSGLARFIKLPPVEATRPVLALAARRRETCNHSRQRSICSRNNERWLANRTASSMYRM